MTDVFPTESSKLTFKAKPYAVLATTQFPVDKRVFRIDEAGAAEGIGF